jgi:2-phosphosulfolactate phosphatase
MTMVFDQSEFDIRCEWGEQGMAQLAPISDVVIIVDVMSFATCVSIAVNRGATVFPYRWKDETARAYAASVNAELAASRSIPEQSDSPYSLSPVSLLNIPEGTRLVLPSPNGSTLSLTAGVTPTFVGCLRNSEAVARAAMELGRRIAVVPAGERWKDDHSLRLAVEDWIGAGAIIQHLEGRRSPEAHSAAASYLEAADDLEDLLRHCASGKELIEMGYASDMPVCAELDVDTVAPILINRAFVRFAAPHPSSPVDLECRGT